jgi:hypothetical protein
LREHIYFTFCILYFVPWLIAKQEFSDPQDADDAQYNLDGREVDGSRIIVEFAKGVSWCPIKISVYQASAETSIWILNL